MKAIILAEGQQPTHVSPGVTIQRSEDYVLDSGHANSFWH
jgi:hypothetical protein